MILRHCVYQRAWLRIRDGAEIGILCVAYAARSRCNGPLTRYAKLRVAHATGMSERFPRHRLQREPLFSDPSMHHGTCVTHVP